MRPAYSQAICHSGLILRVWHSLTDSTCSLLMSTSSELSEEYRNCQNLKSQSISSLKTFTARSQIQPALSQHLFCMILPKAEAAIMPPREPRMQSHSAVCMALMNMTPNLSSGLLKTICSLIPQPQDVIFQILRRSTNSLTLLAMKNI